MYLFLYGQLTLSHLHPLTLCGVWNALQPRTVHVLLCNIPGLVLLYQVSQPNPLKC